MLHAEESFIFIQRICVFDFVLMEKLFSEKTGGTGKPMKTNSFIYKHLFYI
jgi:hypothetical protein